MSVVNSNNKYLIALFMSLKKLPLLFLLGKQFFTLYMLIKAL